SGRSRNSSASGPTSGSTVLTKSSASAPASRRSFIAQMLPPTGVSPVADGLRSISMETVTVPEATKLQGLRAALPFATADVLDGVAFGVVAAGLGVAAPKAITLSVTAFSGSAQFAALTVLGDHGSVLALL